MPQARSLSIPPALASSPGPPPGLPATLGPSHGTLLICRSAGPLVELRSHVTALLDFSLQNLDFLVPFSAAARHQRTAFRRKASSLPRFPASALFASRIACSAVLCRTSAPSLVSVS